VPCKETDNHDGDDLVGDFSNINTSRPMINPTTEVNEFDVVK
jgi:hypothetical protein